jgi:hypothetical protein
MYCLSVCAVIKIMFIHIRCIAIILLYLNGIAHSAEDRIAKRRDAIRQTLDVCVKFPAGLTALVWKYAAPMKLHPVAHMCYRFNGGQNCHNKVRIIRSASDGGIVIRDITVTHKGKLLIGGSGCKGDRPYGEDDDAYELIAKRCNKTPDEIALDVDDFPMVDDNRARLNGAMGMLGSTLWYKVSLRETSIHDPTYQFAQEKSLLFFEQDVTFARFVRGLSHAYALSKSIDDRWFTFNYKKIAQNCEQLAAEIVPDETDVLFEDSEEIFNPYLTW